MDKAELRACLEQADSKEAGALLRAALRNKMREALMEIFEEEVQGLCGPSPFTGLKIGLLQGRKLACEGEAGRARAYDPSVSRA